MAKKKLSNIDELKNVFSKLNDNRSKLALSLLDKAEFLELTLQNLKVQVEKLGVITTMCQGSYEIDRENPALKAYNVTVKNYTSVIKQLNDMLPHEDRISNDDGFDDFGDEQ